MTDLHLITGNKNFSSNSLRPWLLLQEFSVPFTEIKIDLFKPNSTEQLGLYSPSLKVPVLLHDDIKVWDSLPICEYLSETFLENKGWPCHLKKKAAARSVVAEIHSDFQHFKQDWPMNCQMNFKMKLTEALEKEIARLDAIMYCCRRKYGDGGDYLFGRFSIADCFMAPIAISLRTYGAELSWKTNLYIDTLFSNTHLQWWLDQAQDEFEDIPLDKAS
ncbi:MAG: glutathione S-transferase [Pseudomonadales bacterium]